MIDGLVGDFKHFFIFPYIGKNTPNWRTHIFQRGRAQPPTRMGIVIPCGDGSEPLWLWLSYIKHINHHIICLSETRWCSTTKSDVGMFVGLVSPIYLCIPPVTPRKGPVIYKYKPYFGKRVHHIDKIIPSPWTSIESSWIYCTSHRVLDQTCVLGGKLVRYFVQVLADALGGLCGPMSQRTFGESTP